MPTPSLVDHLLQGVEFPSREELPAPGAYQPVGQPGYDGNPFIECIGDHILGVPEFTETVASQLPLAPKGGIQISSNSVLTALASSHVHRVIYPTPSLDRINARFLEVLSQGYLARNPFDRVGGNRVFYMLSTMEPGQLSQRVQSVDAGVPPSFVVMGTSGMGKTFATRFVLGRLPQAYQHREYRGRRLAVKQVIWLYVSCPPTGSLKALLFEVLLALDLVLGTDYYRRWLNSRYSTDVLLINVALVLYTHNLGVLVLDELQHLKARGYAETESLLNFFVALMNFLSIPLVCIGTYASLNVLEGTLRNPRRLTGAGCIEMPRYERNDPVRAPLEDYYCGHLPMPKNPDEATALRGRIYDIYQGIHTLLPNLVQRTLAEMAYRRAPHLNDSILNYYQRVELRLLSKALDALRRRDADAALKFDDLVSDEVAQSWRAEQAKIDVERARRSREKAESKGATLPKGSRTFELAEFPSGHITDADVAREVKRTRAIFGDGDLYAAFQHQGLLAEEILKGKYPAVGAG